MYAETANTLFKLLLIHTYTYVATVPSLVDKENGILKIKEVLTCFPHLTEEQVTPSPDWSV